MILSLGEACLSDKNFRVSLTQILGANDDEESPRKLYSAQRDHRAKKECSATFTEFALRASKEYS